MSVEIKAADTYEDAELIAKIADVVWREHYTPIIGANQVEYMLQNFQSAEKIYSDMKNNGYRYYAAYFDDNKAGYFAIKPDKPSGLFLSKLYVEKRFRGKGIARVMLNKIINICENEGYDNIWLTVNKNNVKSIAVYKKMGFEISEALVTDIGGGFVMDDFKMVLKV